MKKAKILAAVAAAACGLGMVTAKCVEVNAVPRDTTPVSFETEHWLCPKCGHDWYDNQMYWSYCPKCGSRSKRY